MPTNKETGSVSPLGGNELTYVGTVRGGAIVLDAGIQLVEGTRVRVEPIAIAAQAATPERFDVFRMGEYAVDTGIPDLATNIDHYLYGHPKVTDGR